MTFTPKPTQALVLQQKNPSLNKLLEIAGLTYGHILARKDIGVVREKEANGDWHIYNGEGLLMVSPYGCESDLDLSDFTPAQSVKIVTLEDCKKYEPGTVAYYVFKLPGSANPRVLGRTPIAKEILARAKKFATLAEAQEAFPKCLT